MNYELIKADTALCSETDPELFFAQDTEYDKGKASYISTPLAKHLCASCPLTLICLRTAVHNKEDYGIWGGSTPRERRYITTKEQAIHFVEKLKREYGTVKKKRRR